MVFDHKVSCVVVKNCGEDMISHREKLRFDVILSEIDLAGKKQVFETLATSFAQLTGQNESVFLQSLMQQEMKSPSGIGEGVALPHIQIDSIDHPINALLKLKKPTDFKGIDDVPVDIICCVASPSADGPHHLRRLSRLTRLLRDEEFLSSLRKMEEKQDLQNLFLESQTQILMAA